MLDLGLIQGIFDLASTISALSPPLMLVSDESRLLVEAVDGREEPS